MDPELQIMFHVLLLAICFVVGVIFNFHSDYGDINNENKKRPIGGVAPSGTVSFVMGLFFFIPFEILFWVLRWIFV